jgi:ferritin-like metal-binding protein YciE
MAEKSLHDLFLDELKDMYDAEKRLTKALPKLAKAASSTELQSAFTSHLRETEGQVRRLEQVFRSLGEKPSGKKCDGIMGIIEESNTMMEELEEGPILDAALISGAQKAEHYEIASYGTLAYFADIMGHDEAKNLLGETLDEEKATDEKLNKIAKSKVNQQALRGAASYGDEQEGGMFGMARRATAAMGFANDAPRRRSTTRGSSRSSSSRSTASRSSGRRTSRASSKKR